MNEKRETNAPIVLVVDDEAANLESVQRIFQKEGLTALAAHRIIRCGPTSRALQGWARQRGPVRAA